MFDLKWLISCNGIGEILGIICTYILLSIIIFISYVKLIDCVDPFHEVKSKREKKKEVRA
jgi:hypothetical protein